MLGNTNSYADYDSYAASKANVGLDNLSAAGQLMIDSQNGTISNCILEIPQNLKLTLENNVLTLKAGSILTIPASVYTTVTTTQDFTQDYTSYPDGRYVVATKSSGRDILERLIGNCVSGAGATTTAGFAFDTTANEIGYYLGTGTKAQTCTYPFCIVDVVGGVASFAKDSHGNDMIFNGIGFIGHHFFGFPNVKCLIPNGIDDKGLLKSTFHRANAVVIFEMSSYSKYMTIPFGDRWVDYTEVDTYADFLAQYPTALGNTRFYVKELNKTFVYAGGGIGILEQGRLPIAKYTYDGTTVTDFTIRQPYEGAADLLTKDIKEQIGDIDTILHNINSGS